MNHICPKSATPWQFLQLFFVSFLPFSSDQLCNWMTVNEDARKNEERIEAEEICHLTSESRVLEKVTHHMSVFTRGDLVRAAKCIPDM